MSTTNSSRRLDKGERRELRDLGWNLNDRHEHRPLATVSSTHPQNDDFQMLFQPDQPESFVVANNARDRVDCR